ncbi:MAG: hypothetical protein ACFFDF_20445 [Candidatus Odinarchaeota archaeon]
MVEHGGLGVLGYITRVIMLIFYLSSIVSIFGNPSVIPADIRLGFILTGWGFILLGFIVFFLTFIGDFLRYAKDKRG